MIRILIAIAWMGSLIAGIASLSVHAQTATADPITRDSLQKKIEASSEELKRINEQIEETQKSIQETKTQGVTLQREIKTLDSNIKQLNLRIQGDEVTLQKLDLEIESLGLDLKDISGSIGDKREAIRVVFQNLQRKSESSVLDVLLTSKSLAETVFEAQSLSNLNTQLATDIEKLRGLRTEYEDKRNLSQQKLQEIEARKQSLESRKNIVADQKKEQQRVLSETKNRETAYQQSLKELQKRQQDIASEIEKIERELRANIDPSVLPIPRTGVLLMPVENGRLSQDYGATGFAQYNYRGKWHNGVDIAAPIGTPIVAADDGVVAAVGDQDRYCYKGAYGKYIVIHHPTNLTTLYAHLSLYNVKVGDRVKRGDLIGYIGKTGYATGPHLHLTVFARATFAMKESRSCGIMPVGGDMDPDKYL